MCIPWRKFLCYHLSSPKGPLAPLFASISFLHSFPLSLTQIFFGPCLLIYFLSVSVSFPLSVCHYPLSSLSCVFLTFTFSLFLPIALSRSLSLSLSLSHSHSLSNTQRVRQKNGVRERETENIYTFFLYTFLHVRKQDTHSPFSTEVF